MAESAPVCITERDREWAALADSDQYHGDYAAVIADARDELLASFSKLAADLEKRVGDFVARPMAHPTDYFDGRRRSYEDAAKRLRAVIAELRR